MEHKCREGYKMTELGEIPQEWDVAKLNTLAIVKTGPFGSNLHSSDYAEEGIPLVLVKNIVNGKICNKDIPLVDYHKAKELSSYLLEKGDIVFSRVGVVGRCALVKDQNVGWLFSGQTLRLRFKKEKKLSPNFFLYYFSSDSFQNQLNQVIIGTTRQSTSTGVIENANVLVPTFPEQQKIADILSTVDEQIEQTEDLIEKTKELKKGLMKRLLTKGIGHTQFRNTEIGEIPVEWEVKRLGDLFKVSSGNFLSQKNIIPGEYPVYGGNGVTGFHNEYIFEEPKIVIGRVGAKCGCVCISVPKSWITDNALFIDKKLETFNDSFMLFLLEFLELNKYANQTAQPVISGQKIYEIVVGIPPVEEQRKIAGIIIKTSKTIEQYEYKNEKLKELKKALMQKLLTGKLRVKI